MKYLGLIFIVLFLAGCNNKEGGNMKLTSPDFQNNEIIPSKFTCNGENISPELQINDIPKNAKSLALIMDDPDAPAGTWIHWVVWNIPITNTIKEDSSLGREGITSFRTKGYGGPCPPSGTHRYFFKLFALDTTLNLLDSTTAKDLENGMKGHIIAKAELIGKYSKF